MGTHLTGLDSLPAAGRWRHARGLIFGDPFTFYEELRTERPVYELPQVTLVGFVALTA